MSNKLHFRYKRNRIKIKNIFHIIVLALVLFNCFFQVLSFLHKNRIFRKFKFNFCLFCDWETFFVSLVWEIDIFWVSWNSELRSLLFRRRKVHDKGSIMHRGFESVNWDFIKLLNINEGERWKIEVQTLRDNWNIYISLYQMSSPRKLKYVIDGFY